MLATVGNALRAECMPNPSPAMDPAGQHELRFRALMGTTAWLSLPPAVRARFGRRLGAVTAVTYVGEIVETGMTRTGWLLAQVCRLIGGPLPLHGDVVVPSVVIVTKDAAGGGQFWTRIYGRARGFPQVIHSSKRFTGPTGLEEYLGWGVGIALVVQADPQTLYFRSDHFFLAVGPFRLRLPRFLQPGELTISHVDRDDGRFAFALSLRHPLFGEMIRQTGLFRERPAHDDPETVND